MFFEKFGIFGEIVNFINLGSGAARIQIRNDYFPDPAKSFGSDRIRIQKKPEIML
jgi:hypothetical protein